MNRLQILEQAETNIRTNGFAYDYHLRGCQYRTIEGQKCAIGGLIPDSMYIVTMEGLDIRQVLEAFPEVAEFFKIKNAQDEQFLADLQIAHDDAACLEDMMRFTAKVAKMKAYYCD